MTIKYEPNNPGDPVSNTYNPDDHHLPERVTAVIDPPAQYAAPTADQIHYPHGQLEASVMHAWDDVNQVLVPITPTMLGASPVSIPSAGVHYPHGQAGAVLLYAWDDVNNVPVPVTPSMLGGGGGGITFLEEQVANNSIALAFVNSLSAKYNFYQLECFGITNSAGPDTLCVQFSTDGGNTWDGSSVCRSTSVYGYANDSAARFSQSYNGPMIPLVYRVQWFAGTVKLYAPCSSAQLKEVSCIGAYQGDGPGGMVVTGGVCENAAVYTAFRVLFGNSPSNRIFSGKIRCFGIP